MTALRLSWRQTPDPLALSWRGPTDDAMAAAMRTPSTPIAALIGPRGPTGPQGDVGPVGPPSGSVGAVADVDFVQGAPVAISRATGHAINADAGYKPTAFVVGLAGADTLTGFVVTAEDGSFDMADWSAVTGSAHLSPGLPYFLGVGGGLTIDPPVSPNCLTLVGVAASLTTLNVYPASPVQL